MRRTPVLLVLMIVAVFVSACGSQPSPLVATGPFSYPSSVSAPLQRVAILVTVTNHGTDDLVVNPADFIARDGNHQIYAADPTATGADADLVRLATGPRLETLPLPTVTLREADVLSGFIVFDVPEGIRPTELIWRQSDSDQIVTLASPQ